MPTSYARTGFDLPSGFVAKGSRLMHRHRITVESLEANGSTGAATGTSLNFEVCNHDNMFHIVEAVRSKRLVDHDKSAALAIGLKLLSEVALEKRQDPLFAPPHNSLRRFIPQLKAIKLPAYSDTR